jgi:hypothetical protein
MIMCMSMMLAPLAVLLVDRHADEPVAFDQGNWSSEMTQMTSEQIPDFVRDVAATGCDITAVVGVGYVIGDADLSDERYENVAPHLEKICDFYGERDHLLVEITDYLISIGRFFPVWSGTQAEDATPKRPANLDA